VQPELPPRPMHAPKPDGGLQAASAVASSAFRMRWAIAGAATALVLFGVAVLPNTNPAMSLIQQPSSTSHGQLGGTDLRFATPGLAGASSNAMAGNTWGEGPLAAAATGGALRGAAGGASVLGRGAASATNPTTTDVPVGTSGGPPLPRLDLPITMPDWTNEEAVMARFTQAQAGVWTAESVTMRELASRSRSQDKEDVSAFRCALSLLCTGAVHASACLWSRYCTISLILSLNHDARHPWAGSTFSAWGAAPLWRWVPWTA
jgi:hypothetical protein